MWKLQQETRLRGAVTVQYGRQELKETRKKIKVGTARLSIKHCRTLKHNAHVDSQWQSLNYLCTLLLSLLQTIDQAQSIWPVLKHQQNNFQHQRTDSFVTERFQSLKRKKLYMCHSLHVDKWMSCIGLRTVWGRYQTNYLICSRIQFHSLLRIACGSSTVPQNALPMFHTKNSSNFGLISLLEMQVRPTLGFDLHWTECRLRQYKAFSHLLLKVYILRTGF